VGGCGIVLLPEVARGGGVADFESFFAGFFLFLGGSFGRSVAAGKGEGRLRLRCLSSSSACGGEEEPIYSYTHTHTPIHPPPHTPTHTPPPTHPHPYLPTHTLAFSCVCVCVCVTEVGCSGNGTRLVMCNLCTNYTLHSAQVITGVWLLVITSGAAAEADTIREQQLK